MRHLVLGGTGTVGSRVVTALLEAGEDVRVPSRSRDGLDSLPAGAEGVQGDLEDPTTYDRIFGGVDRMFLLNPVSLSELHQGLAALSEARRAGVERVVYLSVHDVEKGAHIPHFSSKIAVERALAESGLDHTVLRPNNFFQNDFMLREAIVGHGVYPQPIGSVGLSRVDAGDIARAAASSLTEPRPESGAVALVGPDPLTGEDCARVWSEALGREVRYAGDDLDAWREQAMDFLPPWMVYDLALMYSMFQEDGLVASEDQLRETETVLGRPPRRYEDFVRETAAAWS